MFSPQTVLVFSIPAFMFILFVPVFVMMYLAVVKKMTRLTTKQAIVTWVFIIAYYALFFTQAPKVTRPYFAQHSHEVTECKVRTVLDDK